MSEDKRMENYELDDVVLDDVAGGLRTEHASRAYNFVSFTCNRCGNKAEFRRIYKQFEDDCFRHTCKEMYYVNFYSGVVYDGDRNGVSDVKMFK